MNDSINSRNSQFDGDATDDLGHLQSIKAALHYSVGKISEEIGKDYGLTFSKPVIASFAEFVNRQIEVYAIDIEAFAKHAKRSRIQMEDIKLLARRSPSFKEAVNEICDSLESTGRGLSKKGKNTKKKKAPKSEGDESEIEIIEDD